MDGIRTSSCKISTSATSYGHGNKGFQTKAKDVKNKEKSSDQYKPGIVWMGRIFLFLVLLKPGWPSVGVNAIPAAESLLLTPSGLGPGIDTANPKEN